MQQMYYSSKEVATLLNVDMRTVQNLCKQGKLKALKINKTYRINKEELQKFINMNQA